MYKASVVVFFVLFSAVASHEQASPVIISNYNLIDSTEPTFVSTIDPAISDEINFTTVIFVFEWLGIWIVLDELTLHTRVWLFGWMKIPFFSIFHDDKNTSDAIHWEIWILSRDTSRHHRRWLHIGNSSDHGWTNLATPTWQKSRPADAWPNRLISYMGLDWTTSWTRIRTLQRGIRCVDG